MEPNNNQRRKKKASRYRFNKLETNNTSKLNILYTNSDSLLNKRHELDLVIDKTKPDVICLTETLPKNTKYAVLNSELSIKNFHLFSNLGNKNCHRGVAIYINNTYNATQIFNNSPAKEIVSCEIKIKGSRNILIQTIYRSPNSTEENNDLINQEILNSSKEYSKILILGDFNYPNIEWTDPNNPTPNCNNSEKFLETIKQSFLHVFRPTHMRVLQNPTTIDLIFTTEYNMITNINHLALLGKSHHHILLFDLFLSSKISSAKQTKRFLYSKGDYNNIKNEFKSISLESLQHLTGVEAWDWLQNKLTNSINKNIPRSSLNHKKKVIWLNAHTSDILKRKQQKYQEYLTKRNTFTYNAYKQARNEAKSTCRTTVKNFENELAKNCATNPKAFFAYAKSKTKTKESFPTICHNNITADNDFEKAQCFNKFFSSVFTSEDNQNIPISTQKPLHTVSTI
jgi:hypothetical protein